MFGRIVEGTFTIVIIGLVLANADTFSTALRAVSSTYTEAIRALSGVAGNR